MGKVAPQTTGRPRFTFRPNPEQVNHRQAWEILQAVPDGQKTAYVVEALLQLREQQQMEELLRRIIREEMKTYTVQSEKSSTSKPAIPEEMLGFLESLATEDG